MSTPAPSSDFPVAAARHLRDGEYLERDGRIVTADHLAGLAAECALKATLLDFLGAVPDRRGVPVSPRPGGKPLPHQEHITKLWDQVVLVARGRAGSAFLSALTSSRPFDTWDIADRYADGSRCTPATTRTRLAEARSLLGRYQQAHILGALS